MKDRELVSMVDYVLELFEKMPLQPSQIECVEHNLKIVKYAKFLKQPLTLGMFIPCDEDGHVLKEPNINEYKSSPFCESGLCDSYYKSLEYYNKAKERVLFKGYFLEDRFLEDRYLCYNTKRGKRPFMPADGLGYYDSIEKVLSLWPLTLTESALKQL